MAYEDQKYQQAAPSQLKTERPATRIEQDTEYTKRMIERVEHITQRVMRHAHSLGYFEANSKEAGPMPPTPVVISLSQALGQLDRAIDTLSGSLNVFD